MANHKWSQFRKNYKTTPSVMEIMNRYNLCTNYENCLEESYNETIRALVCWNRFKERHRELILENLKSTSNVGTKVKSDEPYEFWKRQLSNSFREISPMPCPVLSTLGMQRHEVSFCFECHSANTLEDWIEGHTRAMNIVPTMLQGNHTSNCVHNAKNTNAVSSFSKRGFLSRPSVVGRFHRVCCGTFYEDTSASDLL